MAFSTIFLGSANNTVLKGLHKFKVDMPINANVIAVQSLEHLFRYLYCGYHVGGQKNALQPISSHNTFQPLWPITLFLFGANNYKFSTETRCMI